MRSGVLVTTHGLTLDGVVGQIRAAARAGVGTAWLPQVLGDDALTTLAVTGREVPGIRLGTAVVPTHPRHPLALAGQALTVQGATGGRLTLGIGPSHRATVEGIYGYSYDRPVRHVREYLTALAPLLRGEPVEYRGETVTAVGALDVPGATPPSLMVAALGPAMLRLAGELTDGTVTLFTGPRTIADHVVPTITRAASEAGRPAPRVVVGLAVCVSDDPSARRELLSTVYAAVGTGGEPSYRAMLDREGVATAVDVAIAGDEATVERELRRYADAGATEFMATLFGTDEENARTLELIASFG
ncbi:F420-dependent oxidoreductase-like protein [Streptomyces griseochromogenes]|uniref:F420-dependent oxidoreductase-like protein n=1 Tax=Streptomyces griseochromogenes TaxID=68214 RepID=A0A1B1B0S4_9ACTN|nr:LLM class F420-dependent oxidoreductase [Streptomyces griseochromogenes]ANP52400.1 LLM class F420-dependent oxidoreductase [Streptomyces griseochromogenes]MBP2055307.1 F420-dependent oxidoreductase-like protein [Streptomyces griseochromogenes]